MIKNDERTILITGATGTVGSEVVKQLLAYSSSSDHNLIRAAVHSQNKADSVRHNINSNKPETSKLSTSIIINQKLLLMP